MYVEWVRDLVGKELLHLLIMCSDETSPDHPILNNFRLIKDLEKVYLYACL